MIKLYIEDYETINCFLETENFEISKWSKEISSKDEYEISDLIEDMKVPVLMFVKTDGEVRSERIDHCQASLQINRALRKINAGKIVKKLEDFNIDENFLEGAQMEYDYLCEDFPKFLYCSSLTWKTNCCFPHFEMVVECHICKDKYSYKDSYKSPVCEKCEKKLKIYEYGDTLDIPQDYQYDYRETQSYCGNFSKDRPPKIVKELGQTPQNQRKILIEEVSYGINEGTHRSYYIFLSEDYEVIKRENQTFSIIKIN